MPIVRIGSDLEESSKNETELQREIRVQVEALDLKLRQLNERRAAIADEARAAVKDHCERFRDIDSQIGKTLAERNKLVTTYHRGYPINIGDVVDYSIPGDGLGIVQVPCRVVDEWRGHFAVEPLEDSPFAGEGMAIVPPFEVYRLQKPQLGARPYLPGAPCCEERIRLIVEDSEPF